MRSYLWLLPQWKRLLLREDVIQTSFHHCEYGGLRRKETRLVRNVPSFKELERRCAGGHVHLGWGKIGKSWATAAETAYPWGLCKSMANLLKQHFVALGCSAPPTNLAGTANPNQAARAFTGIQSRKLVPPLLSEFASVHTVLVPGNLANTFLRPDWRPGTMSQCTPELACLPAGSRVLRAHVLFRGFCDGSNASRPECNCHQSRLTRLSPVQGLLQGLSRVIPRFP